jgi:hypothetical protein
VSRVISASSGIYMLLKLLDSVLISLMNPSEMIASHERRVANRLAVLALVTLGHSEMMLVQCFKLVQDATIEC